MTNASVAGAKVQQSKNGVVDSWSVKSTLGSIFPQKIENKNVAIWTSVTLLIGGAIGCYCYNYKQKSRSKATKDINTASTENDVLKMAAKTACTIMEKSMNAEQQLLRVEHMIEKFQSKMSEVTKSASNDSQTNDNPQNPTEWVSMSYSNMIGMERVQEDSIAPGLIGMGLVNYIVAGASIGKTILVTQIALAAAYGNHVQFLPNKEGKAIKMTVLYYRMEEYDGEFQNKYGKGTIIQKAGILWRTKTMMKDFTLNGLIQDIKLYVAQYAQSDTLICIDPITKLPDFNAEKFIIGTEEIKEIAKSKGITLTYIVSAHVDEIKDWSPLTSVNIKGSDKLIQQGGSVTALRKERSSRNSRFLQVLKAPKGYAEPDKVIVSEIIEEEIGENDKNTFLNFVCEKTENEALPLRVKAQDTTDDNAGGSKSAQELRIELAKKANELIESGLTKVATAEKLGISRPTLDKLLAEID